MSDGDERELVEGLKQGRVEAQRQLFDSHRVAVFRFVFFALLKGSSHHDAEDITQDAFLRAFRSIGSFRGDCQLRTWLFTLARNATVDHRRKAQRFPELGTDDDQEALSEVPDPHSTPREGPAAGVLAQEQRDHLRDLLAKLPDAQREAVTHRLMSGLSVEETARAMNKTGGAVKMLQKRALDALAERVQAHGSYFADLRPGKGVRGHDGE